MNKWNPLVGETLKCRQESSHELDKNAAAIITSYSWEKEAIVGYIPQNISKTCSMFLKVLNASIQVQVVGKRLNRGEGMVLKSSYLLFLWPRKTCKLVD